MATLLVAVLLLAGPAQRGDSLNESIDARSQALYEKAEKAYAARKYEAALEQYYAYLETARTRWNRSERFLASIERVARIELDVNQDPQAAREALGKFRRFERLSDAEEDTIDEWLAYTRERQVAGKLTGARRIPPIPEYDDVDRHAVDAYRDKLVQLTSGMDSDQITLEALQRSARLHRRMHRQHNYQLRVFYLKEIIRRFPHTESARTAHEELVTAVRIEYMGSAGQDVPPSIDRMLERLERTAAKRTSSK